MKRAAGNMHNAQGFERLGSREFMRNKPRKYGSVFYCNALLLDLLELDDGCLFTISIIV